ncbi:hypothetical protein QQS21_001921 [Conoideocrella luteorostrata]|uniref:Uncharacterized protein n=1 Tax=Conoideocrella luteorostrata TaxID=1105319 RepID=A0AAJ0FX21_9HYPO|nr:hypothetical protein QQS21_001921 [Conoideocrella luteorostrata]
MGLKEKSSSSVTSSSSQNTKALTNTHPGTTENTALQPSGLKTSGKYTSPNQLQKDYIFLIRGTGSNQIQFYCEPIICFDQSQLTKITNTARSSNDPKTGTQHISSHEITIGTTVLSSSGRTSSSTSITSHSAPAETKSFPPVIGIRSILTGHALGSHSSSKGPLSTSSNSDGSQSKASSGVVSSVKSSTTSTTVPPAIVTTLPSGASLVTLTHGTQTKPEYITITNTGTRQETIVPVIIPVQGPPIICYGCHKSFPPNIKIDTPGFCVQLFGHKIGKCTQDHPGDPGDVGKSKPSKEPPAPEKTATKPSERRESTKLLTSNTSTLSQSCTQTVTASYVSVFCTVARVAKQPRGEPSKGCSSLTYKTIRGCSVTNSIATKTTTVQARKTFIPCAPGGRCGGGGGKKCPGVKRSLPDDDDLRNLTLTKRTDEQRQWEEPKQGENNDQYVARQVRLIYNNHFGKYVKLSADGASPDFIQFGNKVESLAVQGLYGCTYVIVVSRRGVWANHLWEGPTFSNPWMDAATHQ